MEVWKNIPGYEGLYLVSNFGKVKSMPRKGNYTERILGNNLNRQGYCRARLSKNNNSKHNFVHRLVAVAFIPKVDGKHEINHRDGNKLNNHADNLEWCNGIENIRHSWATGLCTKRYSEKNPASKKVINLITDKIYPSARDAFKDYGVNSERYFRKMLYGKSVNKTEFKYV